jgi:predicted RNA binding protein YcfA (HicA-like mRNA interferase family)
MGNAPLPRMAPPERAGDSGISSLECIRVLQWLGFEHVRSDDQLHTLKRAEDGRTVLVPRHQMPLTSAQLDVISMAAGTATAQLFALSHPRFQSDVMPRVDMGAIRRRGLVR